MNNWWFMSDKLMYLLFPFTILIVFGLRISRRLIYDGIDEEICVKMLSMVSQLLHNRHFNGKTLPNPKAMRCLKLIKAWTWHQSNAFSIINASAVYLSDEKIPRSRTRLDYWNQRMASVVLSNYLAYPAHNPLAQPCIAQNYKLPCFPEN